MLPLMTQPVALLGAVAGGSNGQPLTVVWFTGTRPSMTALMIGRLNRLMGGRGWPPPTTLPSFIPRASTSASKFLKHPNAKSCD